MHRDETSPVIRNILNSTGIITDSMMNHVDRDRDQSCPDSKNIQAFDSTSECLNFVLKNNEVVLYHSVIPNPDEFYGGEENYCIIINEDGKMDARVCMVQSITNNKHG